MTPALWSSQGYHATVGDVGVCQPWLLRTMGMAVERSLRATDIDPAVDDPLEVESPKSDSAVVAKPYLVGDGSLI